MPLNPQVTFSQARCMPVYGRGKQVAVPLAPGTYQAGQLVGQITSNNTNDVQTVTVSGAPTHATLTLYNLPGGLSYAAAQDVTPAALTTALNALLGPNAVAVTGTYAAGSGGTYIFTWGGAYAGQLIQPLAVAAVFVGGTTPAAANVHTTPGVGPKGAYGIYVDANTDGTGVAIGILEYPCVVVGGQIFLGSQPSSEFGQSEGVVPMWFGDANFDTADLVGLDAAAVTDLKAHYITGSGSTGVLRLP